MSKTSTSTSSKNFAYIGGKLGDRLQISRDGGTTWVQQALITNADDAGLALDMCRTSKPAKQYRIVGPAGDDVVKVHPTLPEVTPSPAGEEVVDLADVVNKMATMDHSAEFIKDHKPATEDHKMVTPKKSAAPAAAKPAAKPVKGGKGEKPAPVAEKPTKPVKATKPAPVAEKASAAKPAPAGEGGLNGSKVKILQALAQSATGLSRADLKKITGLKKGFSRLMGAPTKGTPGAGTLEGDGYVKSAVSEGVRGVVYTLTAKGRKATGK